MEIKTVEVRRCARCGKDHKVVFKPLTNPIIVGDSTFDWWGMCPELHEPVIMYQKVKDVPSNP